MRFSINGGFLFEINDLDDEAAATRLDTITDQFNAHLDVFTMMLPEHVRDGDGGIFEVGYEGLDTDADRVVDLLHERHESEPSGDAVTLRDAAEILRRQEHASQLDGVMADELDRLAGGMI